MKIIKLLLWDPGKGWWSLRQGRPREIERCRKFYSYVDHTIKNTVGEEYRGKGKARVKDVPRTEVGSAIMFLAEQQVY